MEQLINHILWGGLIVVLCVVCYVIYRRMFSTTGVFVRGTLGFIFILVLCAINVLVFRHFLGLNYFLWFLQNGSLITLSFAIIAVVWDDLNKNTALIERYPPRFIAGCLWLVSAFLEVSGSFWRAVGTLLKDVGNYFEHPRDYSKPSKATPELKNEYESPGVAFLLLCDAVAAVCLALIILATTVSWCLTVAPFLYFVHLVSGAPARMALAAKADRLVILRNEDGSLRFEILDQSKPLPANAAEISFTKKPFALTSALSAALLWIIKYLGPWGV